MSLMKMESVKSLTNNRYIRLIAPSNITNNYSALVTSEFSILNNKNYILHFKAIVYKDVNIKIKFRKNTGEIIDIGEINLNNCEVIQSVNGRNEYLCVLRFLNTFDSVGNILIGTDLNSSFKEKEKIIDIREVALQQGTLLLPYSTNSDEVSKNSSELNAKLDLLAGKFTVQVDRVDKDIHGLEERTNTKIEATSNAITEEVTNVAQGNLIVNGAYETANIYGWNIGGTRTVVENYYYHDRSLNYININSPNSGSSSWSNRFEVEASKDYQLSGLFFSDPNLTLTIKIKFSNSIPNANDFEHEGQFDEELTLESWQSSSNAFIEKFFVFKAPVTAKTAFIEIIYNNGIGYCGWTEVMVVKGTKPIPYIEKKSSYSRVFEKLTPNSIINTVNKGLTEGSAIAVAGTILDENGFSQLNNNKLSVRLNNNGTHIYSFLEEGKVNGSIEALRDKRTNDDIMGMTHKTGAFLTISYPKPNAPGDYLSYVVFDKYGIAYPVPISIFEDVDLNGTNLWLNKYTKDVGSRIFGGVRGDGRGFASIQGTNLQFVNPASGEFHFNVTREDFDVYSSRLYVRGDLSVIGNKNCIQKTKYGDIPFYSNEDINSLLTDTEIDAYLETKEFNGKFICKVEIDEIIQECLNTQLPYNVYIDKKDFGDYRVDIKEPTYFIVESDKPIRFKYKLEARRRNFEKESKTNNFMRKMTVSSPLNKIPDEPITKERESILYKPGYIYSTNVQEDDMGIKIKGS